MSLKVQVEKLAVSQSSHLVHNDLQEEPPLRVLASDSGWQQSGHSFYLAKTPTCHHLRSTNFGEVELRGDHSFDDQHPSSFPARNSRSRQDATFVDDSVPTVHYLYLQMPLAST